MSRPANQPCSSERGIALLVVVSVLTVVAIMGVSFVFSMFLETQASRQFVAATQARYIAEAGVAHARAVLDEDRLGSRFDDLTEAWAGAMAGSDVDVDGDGTLDGRWWLMSDADGSAAGRYGVLVHDEAGKANLNVALADPAAHGVDGLSLSNLLSQVGVPDAAGLAAAIEAYRYGPDGAPGVAGVDDDRDGTVDEPDEYQSLVLRGDDRRVENLEEVLSLAPLDEEMFRRLAAVATVYSWDTNLSVMGQPRLNVNTATADEILKVLLEKGGEDPWQLAVNMADAVDPDLAMSRIVKVSTMYEMADQGPQGDWTFAAAPVKHYETGVAEASLAWTVSVSPGTFWALVRGVPGSKVGDVTIGGQTKASMAAGETFGTLEVTSEPLTITVVCREGEGATCAFRGIELVPTDSAKASGGFVVRGIEAVRFNELMASPTVEFAISEAAFNRQNSDWACAAICSNSGVGTASWTWTTTAGQANYVPPGKYHLRLYGQLGDAVGQVNSDATVLMHGARAAKTLIVVEAGDSPKTTKFTVTLGKTAGDRTYYFQKVSLSLQPDAEYVELINVSDKDIDVSGWTIEGAATGGRTASLPEGATIAAHGLLVAAVDVDDTQPGLENDITASAAWEIPAGAPIVQLTFLEQEGPLSPDMDWLVDTLPPDAKSLELILKDQHGWVVDDIEYHTASTTASFQSLEKGDPTVVRDDDQDGLDEGWYPSLKQYTPAAPNDNEGLLELGEDLEQIVHDPAKEVTVLNRPLHSIGELAGLASGVAWHSVASADLANIVDQLTVEGLRLETQAAELAEGADRWHETLQGYETSKSSGQGQAGAVGAWRWTDIPDGTYRLSLYGWSGEQLSVRWAQADGSYNEWTPSRSMDAQGRLIVGQVTVGMEQSPTHTLTLQVRCDSESQVCHFQYLVLDPQLTLVGRININTAPREVLLSLSGMTPAVVDRLIASRPYGDQGGKARGIGDVLSGSVLGETEEDKLSHFRQIAHLVTVRSQVFQIMSLGETLEHHKPTASKRIQAVVQR